MTHIKKQSELLFGSFLGLPLGLALALVFLPLVHIVPELLGIELRLPVLVDALVPQVDLVAGLGEYLFELVGGDLSASADQLEPDLVVNLASGLRPVSLLANDETVDEETMVLEVVHIEQLKLLLEGSAGATFFDDLLEKLVSIGEAQLAAHKDSCSVVEIRGLQKEVQASVG